jgi:hypothetical protein
MKLPGELTDEVINELHGLLWDKPRLNRGEYDPGWSCRDHAVAIAGIISLNGLAGGLRHGRCFFIQGASADGPPVGVGQESSSRSGHTWNWIEGFGDLDLSPRLNERDGQWRPVSTLFGIIGSTWSVRDLHTDVVVCRTRREYDNAIARASYLRNAGRAVYWIIREEPFRPELLVDGAVNINSPRTRRIIELAGKNAYVKLVVHLHGVQRGTRKPLSGVSFARAWTRIGEISDQQAGELVHLLGTRPPSSSS